MAARRDSDVAMDDAPTSHQPEVKDDTMVDDEGDDFDENEGEEEEEEVEIQRVKLLPGSTETAASFEFANEGHTLGNALRYVIMRNPDVEFCAYAIPHPSEAKMNVRIQTFEGTTAIEALEKGLRDIQELCDVVTEKFVKAAADFAEKKAATG
ncbi:putative DNA-directed RNA polymerases I and III subunit RPAC2 [Triangularia verruculosa]|uniref:DNA-directed RNA polymerases I and III subunit RPAC2 n=1 Tax=Triangularia verruculosa TaxID=2587418 RepID=A0AAN7AT91_9PEZI|nr:putative DNA-directed RNA polymerases I and III subunit RPAC2 [Triangularia verruculosa]